MPQESPQQLLCSNLVLYLRPPHTTTTRFLDPTNLEPTTTASARADVIAWHPKMYLVTTTGSARGGYRAPQDVSCNQHEKYHPWWLQCARHSKVVVVVTMLVAVPDFACKAFVVVSEWSF